MLNLNNTVKQIILALMDFVLMSSALYFALLLRFEGQIPPEYFAVGGELIIPVALLNLLFSLPLGLYRRLCRYAGINEVILLALTSTLTSAGAFIYSWHLALMLPRSTYIIFWFLLFLILGASRISLLLLASYLRRNGGQIGNRKALIVGAGDAGVIVAKEIKKQQGLMGIKPVGFIDDDPNKHGKVIQGIPVLGGREKLPSLVRKKNIKEVVVSMPSTSYANMRELLAILEGLAVNIKTVPGIFEILEGHVGVTHLKEVEVEDLLKRPPVKVNIAEIADYLTDRIVLITGAGGSIGSELCRQISLLHPRRILLLDQDENGIFCIHNEMKEKHPRVEFCPSCQQAPLSPSPTPLPRPLAKRRGERNQKHKSPTTQYTCPANEAVFQVWPFSFNLFKPSRGNTYSVV